MAAGGTAAPAGGGRPRPAHGRRIRALLRARREPCGLIGSDVPGLRRQDVLDAFAALDVADLVLGPARDGGYYLVALRAPQPALFEGVTWSTATCSRRRSSVRRVPGSRSRRCARCGTSTPSRTCEPSGRAVEPLLRSRTRAGRARSLDGRYRPAHRTGHGTDGERPSPTRHRRRALASPRGAHGANACARRTLPPDPRGGWVKRLFRNLLRLLLVRGCSRAASCSG